MYSLSTMIIANLLFWTALHIFGAAAVTSLVPYRFYNPTRFVFKERPFEQRVFRAIRIKGFKDKLPIYRHNDGMLDRRRLAKKISGEYLTAFIAETCKAELVHAVIALFGFASLTFVFAGLEPLYLFFIIAVAVLCLHMPFILVQRYNRHRLVRLLRRMK